MSKLVYHHETYKNQSFYLEQTVTYGVDISTQLHIPELLPCPVGVKLCGAHECEMYSKTPVHSGAV